MKSKISIQVTACVVLSILTQPLKGQQNPALQVFPKGPPAFPMFISDINGNPVSSQGTAGVEGSPYLIDDWAWGALKFANGKFAKDISLRYNLHSDEVHFNRNGQQLEPIDRVVEFMIGYQKNGDSIAHLFRSGFPAIGNNSSETFYEVLVDGEFQLLKKRRRSIVEQKIYNQPARQRFQEDDQLYALLPGNRIIKLGKNKDAIVEGMLEYGNTAKGIAEKEQLKLKTEESIRQLFRALNQQQT